MVTVASQAHEKAQLALKMRFGNGLKVRTFRVLARIASNIYVYECVIDLLTLRSFTYFFPVSSSLVRGQGSSPVAGGCISAGLLCTRGSDH